MQNKASGKGKTQYMIFSDTVMAKDKYKVTSKGKVFANRGEASRFIKNHKMKNVKIMKW